MNAMKASDSLRNFVESIAKFATWALAPLVIITMWDVIARKFVFIQIYMVANFGRISNQHYFKKWSGIYIQWYFVWCLDMVISIIDM